MAKILDENIDMFKCEKCAYIEFCKYAVHTDTLKNDILNSIRGTDKDREFPNIQVSVTCKMFDGATRPKGGITMRELA